MTFSFPVEDRMIDKLAAFGIRFDDLGSKPLKVDEVNPISA